MSASDAASILALLKLARSDAAARARQAIRKSSGNVDTECAAAVRGLVMASDDDALFVGACIAGILAIADIFGAEVSALHSPRRREAGR